MNSVKHQFGLGVASLASSLLAAYLLTMAPSYTFEDTALFTAACASLGVVHPPGYPLWVWVCAPFGALARATGFTVAQGASFFSAAAATTCCVLLARFLWRHVGNAPVAVGVAACCGLSLSFWSQAIIPEAYALNALLFMAALTVADSYVDHHDEYKLAGLALLGGLGLANHWPLFVIAAPVIVLWLLPAWPALRRDLTCGRVWGLVIAGLLLGLAPYAHLWLAPADSVRFLAGDLDDSVWSYVTREQFAGQDSASSHPRWDHRVKNGGWAVLSLLGEYTLLGGLLGLLGLWLCWQRLPRWRMLALVWSLLGTTLVLALYRPYLAQSDLSTQIFSNYGLTACLAFALPIAVVLASVCAYLRLRLAVQWLSAAMLAAGMLAWHGPQINRSADDLAVRHAELTNATVPLGAKMLLGDGNSDFPLAYLGYLLTDVEYNIHPVILLDYLGKRGRFADLPAMLALEDGPIVLSAHVEYSTAPLRWLGTHAQYDKDATTSLVMLDAARDLLRHAALLRDTANNVSTRDFADRLLFEFARRAHVARTAGTLMPADAELLEQLGDTVALRFAAYLNAATDTTATLEMIQAQLTALGNLQRFPLSWRTDILTIYAVAQLRAGQVQSSTRILENALQDFPAAHNVKVLNLLLTLHAQAGNFKRYAYLRRRYPSLSAGLLTGNDRRCAANLNRDCRL